MEEEIIESYLQAGKAVAKALKLAKIIVRPGTKFLDIATLCEGEILKNGCGLGFPANISLDSIAAHYSPELEDPTVCPDHGLLKVDCGAEVNGFIADAAITINIGEDKGIYADLVQASEEGLAAALKVAGPGVGVSDIGTEIYKAIAKHNVKPISNLGGHGLDAYQVHESPFIPNVPNSRDGSQLQPDRAYAIEPFTTDGYGSIQPGKVVNIFEFVNLKKKKNMKIDEVALAQKFKKKFNTLPFSPRAVDFIQGTDNINDTINKFEKRGILRGYPIFEEIGRGLVAQTEHSLLILKDGAHVYTVEDNDL
jgi:methionyl aminopeptidase